MAGKIQPSIEGAVKAALNNTPDTSPQPEITRAIMAALEGGGGGTGGGTVKWFATTGDRDAYYAANPDELAKNPTVGVGDPAVAWQWNGTAWAQSAIALQGPKGDAATVSVGTTTTLPAGSQATVTNSGTASAAVFDFGIPKGADGSGGTSGVSTVNGFEGNVSIGTSAAANIKVQDFFSTTDFAVGTSGRIEALVQGMTPEQADRLAHAVVTNDDGVVEEQIAFLQGISFYSQLTIGNISQSLPGLIALVQDSQIDAFEGRIRVGAPQGDYDVVNKAYVDAIPIARKPELFKYGGDTEEGYTPISSNVIPVVNSIRFIDEILILNSSTGLYYLQDNGSDYTVGTNTVTINSPTLTDGMKIKIAYHS